MLRLVLPLALLVASVSAGQEQPAQATRQLPAPTDIDPQVHPNSCGARSRISLMPSCARMPTSSDCLVGHEYTLRVGDVPQSPGGLPRAIWMANTLSSGRTKAESVDLRASAWLAGSPMIWQWSA